MFALVLATKLVVAAGPTQLVLDIQPAGVEVKLDGKAVGTSGDKPFTLKVKPGVHLVRVSFKGDAHEEEVHVKAGEKKTFVLKLEDGRAPVEPTEASSP